MPSLHERLFARSGMPLLLRQFGIPVVCFPRPDVRRHFAAICVPIEGSDTASQFREDNKERMWVSCPKRYADGMAAATLGMALQRLGVDDAGEKWSWSGEVRNETTEGWDLLFERVRPQRYGPK
jgi:hypothetical protein